MVRAVEEARTGRAGRRDQGGGGERDKVRGEDAYSDTNTQIKAGRVYNLINDIMHNTTYILLPTMKVVI